MRQPNEQQWTAEELDALRCFLGEEGLVAAAEALGRTAAECDRAANSLLGRSPREALPYVNAVIGGAA
jgi:hypothetical protein